MQTETAKAGISEKGIDHQVRSARDRLLSLVQDFPFAGPAAQSAWLAGVLSFHVCDSRPPSAPFFLVDGDGYGLGKGLLVSVAALVGTGELPVIISPSDAMRRPIIVDYQRKAATCVLVDHISAPFGSELFDSRLFIEERPPIIRWGTGNNVRFKVSADTERLTLRIRLKSKKVRRGPFARLIKQAPRANAFVIQDLLRHAQLHRNQLADDCRFLLHACSGLSPSKRLRRWGGFEEWSQVVRHTIVCCGLVDPLEGRAF